MKTCRLQHQGGAQTPAAAPDAQASRAPAAPSLTVAQAPATANTASECNAEYAANKAAIRSSGQKKADFIAACRAGNETVPTAAAAPTRATHSSVCARHYTDGSSLCMD